jgi:DNA invertase Pin-like site-specific DNA recombinase
MTRSVTRAAIYCRLSRAGGQGIERQEEDCRRIAAERGWDLAEVFTETGSASPTARKARVEWERLKEGIEAHEFDAVIFWMEDRSNRDVIQAGEFVKVCQQAGLTKVVLPTYEYDFTDQEDVAKFYGEVIRAQQEIARLSKRVTRQKQQNAQAGKRNGGRRGFGSTGAGRTKVSLWQALQEQELIREAVSRVLAGESLQGIARDWKARGVRTPGTVANPDGGTWSGQNLRQMLLSPAIAGYRTHNGKLIETTEWEPIVPREQWEAVRALLNSPERLVLGRRGRPAGHLLTGIVVCGNCGGQMGTSYYSRGDGTRTRIYACRHDVLYGGCGRVNRRAEPVEELIAEALFRAVEGPEWDRQQATAEQATGNPRIAELSDKLAADRAILDHLDDQAVDYGWSPEKYKQQVARVEARMDRARAELARLQGSHMVAAVPRNLRQVWSELSLSRRRAIVAAVFTRVEIHPQGQRRKHRPDGGFAPTTIDPSAIKVTLRDR